VESTRDGARLASLRIFAQPPPSRYSRRQNLLPPPTHRRPQAHSRQGWQEEGNNEQADVTCLEGHGCRLRLLRGWVGGRGDLRGCQGAAAVDVKRRQGWGGGPRNDLKLSACPLVSLPCWGFHRPSEQPGSPGGKTGKEFASTEAVAPRIKVPSWGDGT
jgi:hypothetical protein